MEPEEINKKELMEYYGYKGFWGNVRIYWFFLRDYIIYMLAFHGPHSGLTVMLNRLRGVKIGKHVYIGPRVFIDGVYPQLVSIEDYVSIGMNTMIYAHSNPTCSLELKQKYYPRYVAPTKIKKGAWITPGCIILAGITIGENAVVGTGSVVTNNVEPYTVVAGNPARIIKKLKVD
jgi:acetyltransferase-like isoleucine patch superfamily enzyme